MDKPAGKYLDAELRDVAVPSDLSARLKSIATLSDQDIDLALLAVHEPLGLSGRVREAIADEVIDDLLRDVTVPSELIARLRITPAVRPDATLRRFVLAASLLFILLGSFFGAMGGLLASIRPQTYLASSLQVIDLGPTQLVSTPLDPISISTDQKADLFDGKTVPVVWKGGQLDLSLVRLDETRSFGPAGQLLRDVERGLELDRDIQLMRWGAYGSPQHASRSLPNLDQLQRRADTGVDLPLVNGYDRSFLMRTGTHPPVFVNANERLQSIQVPLTTSASSFDRTAELVRAGRLPDRQEVRIEDFLAAVEYDFVRPTDDELAITITAGPTLGDEKNHKLLQVGVQAAKRLGNRKTHLSVVIDVSQSMRHESRLAVVQAAVHKLLDHLSHDDSVSLVAVNHEVTQELEFARRDDQEQFASWLDSLRAGGGDQLHLGISAAVSLAWEAPCDSDSMRQLVVLTDSTGKEAITANASGSELLATAANTGLQVTVLSVDEPSTTSGDVVSTVDWRLVELATGVSSVVAADAEFEVFFNPRAVQAYRLVGHGPSAMTGLSSRHVGGELRSGQQASLLFEVWVQDSQEDEVAGATLRWTSAGSGSLRNAIHASLGRYDVATTHEDSPESLRLAEIAAEIGGRLRGSRDFDLAGDWRFRDRRKPIDWASMLPLLDDVSPETKAREDVWRLLELVRGLDSLSRPTMPSPLQ